MLGPAEKRWHRHDKFYPADFHEFSQTGRDLLSDGQAAFELLHDS
jgi:hypothetical protein